MNMGNLGVCALGCGIGATIGGVLGAGLGALSSVISGSTGAAIMQVANYTGYNIIEAAQMGATGGSILSGAEGMLIGSCAGLLSYGLFGGSAKATTTTASSGIIVAH